MVQEVAACEFLADGSEFKPDGPKTAGCAVGALFLRNNGDRYIGKLGEIPEFHGTEFSKSKEYQGMTSDAGKEVLATLLNRVARTTGAF